MSNNIREMIDKRGQITTFIVVGIIILFAVGFVIYAASLQPSLKIFGQKESELQQYIGACLSDTTEKAVTSLGITGGYLQIPDSIAFNERAYFSFGTRTQPKIPLWYYRGEPRIPSKEFIGKQISDYVTQNIDACLGNFDVFKDRFDLRLYGNVSTEAIITDNAVSVKLNYPLEAKDRTAGVITKLNFVSRDVNVKLGRIYNMAVDIMHSENRKLFFENLTVDLLSSNPAFPFNGLDFTCNPKTWRKSALVSEAQDMVYNNLQQVGVEGNKFTLFDKNDLYAQNHFILPMDNQYSDLGAVFFYPKTARFEMHIRPNDREVIHSNVGRPLGKGLLEALPICINNYHFTYDIEYPLLATLKDTSAFDGRGFTFNFAFPVTINHNQGDKTDFPQSTFEAPDLNYDFCNAVSDKNVDIRVKDAFTSEELYKADVDYKCVRYSCNVGNTSSNGGIYRITTKLPQYCTNGLLSSHPDGYLEGSTVYDGSDYAEILVKPLSKFNINIVKHDSDNFGKTEALQPGETVSLVITDLTDPDFEQFYTSDSNDTQIQLVNGDAKYHIEALLLQDGERMTGGYIGDWDVKYGDLAGKTDLTLNVVQKIPIAVSEQQQQDTSLYLFDDKSYQDKLKPTFS